MIWWHFATCHDKPQRMPIQHAYSALPLGAYSAFTMNNGPETDRNRWLMTTKRHQFNARPGRTYESGTFPQILWILWKHQRPAACSLEKWNKNAFQEDWLSKSKGNSLQLKQMTPKVTKALQITSIRVKMGQGNKRCSQCQKGIARDLLTIQSNEVLGEAWDGFKL